MLWMRSTGGSDREGPDLRAYQDGRERLGEPGAFLLAQQHRETPQVLHTGGGQANDEVMSARGQLDPLDPAIGLVLVPGHHADPYETVGGTSGGGHRKAEFCRELVQSRGVW